ncbi:NYN domain-containing protein [Frankia sp. AgB32]|uniref:NYN domain-containing protein n=1 Tax=Frankia sp. AgB32 TaxID=631119 RepID=UPI00200BA9EB|nr:NYN domain-containing protein [Frankia sp. AgB32]MCK9895968.1 NYN domain-containing protein [Frankia sp. AgB32]
MTPRVAVFIDYQNVHFSARSRFLPADAPRHHGHVDPGRVAERIVAGRRFGGELTSVRVYRGRPSPDHQQAAARASDRQAARWERDPRVTVVRRQLRYPKSWPVEPAQEKGIDVALAVDFVRLACENAYDVGILFSRDTDLVPALEAVRDLESGLVHVEVASWTGASRIRFPDSQLPWCHYLGADDYEACRDDTDYTLI